MDQLDELRTLLLGREKETLDRLEEYVEDPVIRARDLASVLPEAIAIRRRQDDSLTRALQQPVSDSIRRSIQHDSKSFADALYPAMVPAIRKAIAETLKSLVQSINQSVEHSLSPRGLGWRFEAWRTGVPFGEVVLKHTLVYRVEEAYLIHSESGMLAGYVSQQGTDDSGDRDAISGMLTAVQDFVRDAFDKGANSDLDTLDMGDYTVWLVRGPQAMLACTVSGIAPVKLREHLAGVLSEVHAVYADALVTFQGDRSTLADIEQLLAECLRMETRPPAKGRAHWLFSPFAVLVLLLLLGLGAWAWYGVDRHQRARALALAQAGQRAAVQEVLERTPGVIPLEVRHRDGRLYIRGLRDPHARELDALLRESGLDPAQVQTSFQPILSLDRPIHARRLTASLRLPASVTAEVKGETLTLRGTASAAWIRTMANLPFLPDGIASVDLSGVSEQVTDPMPRIREALQPPEGVRLSLSGGALEVSGTAPWDWISGVPLRLRGVNTVRQLRDGGITPLEWREAQTLGAQVDGRSVYFSEGLVLASQGGKTLDGVGSALLRLVKLDERMGLGLRLRIIGNSDGVGDRQRNQWLRLQRAQYVRSLLARKGIAEKLITVAAHEAFKPSAVVDRKLRRVDIEVTLQAPRLQGWSLQP